MGVLAADPAALLLEGAPRVVHLPDVSTLDLVEYQLQHAISCRLIAACRTLHKIFLLLAALRHIARTVILHHRQLTSRETP